MTIGLEMTATARNNAGRGDMGRLVHIPIDALLAPSSQLCPACWSAVLDIAPLHPDPNPDPNLESDPYALLVDKGQGSDDDSLVLVDSSRNWLARIGAQGEFSRMAVFPSRFQGRSTDSVPTTIARGPDGDYYVGELVGIPFATTPTVTRPPANIYRVSADPPHDVSVFLTGFNAIIGVAFQGEDLYVLQHWSSFTSSTLKDGKLIRRRTVMRDVDRASLDGPTSVLIGRGAIYISHHGASPAFVGTTRQRLGEVLRLALDDDEEDDEEGE